jgi:steroid 5-alpha reductase family enzyme
VALRWRFFSLVDVVWSYLFTGVVALYVILPGGWAPRRWLLLGVVTFWSVRLGTHLLTRLAKHFPTEDNRYSDLRQKWAKNLKSNFLLFFLFQGLSNVILALPFLVISLNPTAQWSPMELFGVIVWLIGVVGESSADAQLRRFRHEEKNRGEVCQVGLWRYSRHPNYFFEWVIWVGYALMAWPAPFGALGLSSPLLMLYLLTKVTGVPYAEASSLKSKGDKFREYQKRVNAFWPWWPRRG